MAGFLALWSVEDLYRRGDALLVRRSRHSAGKFVIPNPFGPYEEARFCTYLVNTWRKGQVAEVRAPDYVRDNIHVDLLAKVYAEFACATAGGPAFARANPSGYVETQCAFALRYAREVAPRLGLEGSVICLLRRIFPSRWYAPTHSRQSARTTAGPKARHGTRLRHFTAKYVELAVADRSICLGSTQF